jgi:two-component sensor histidine kinase
MDSVQKENGTSIALKTDIDSEPLPVDHPIPLGLIVNELIMNAVKYAFPGETRGSVAVTLKRLPGELRLTVADEGRGLDPRRADSGVGGRLVDTLCATARRPSCTGERQHRNHRVPRIAFARTAMTECQADRTSRDVGALHAKPKLGEVFMAWCAPAPGR